jgi:hypothetical protein
MIIVVPSGATAQTHVAQTAPRIVELGASTPDFSLTANPTSFNVPVGGSQMGQVIVTSQNGFTGTVDLQAFSFPAQVSLSPSSLDIASGGSQISTLTVQVPAGSPEGDYPIFVGAVSGCTAAHSVGITVHITGTGPDFTIVATKNPLTVSQSTPDSTDLVITSMNGFSGTVSIYAFSENFTVSPPTGSVTLASGGTQTITISATLNPSTEPGNYTLSVAASSGFLFHSAEITVIVPGPTFIISSSPEILALTAGSSCLSTITATGIDGFTGQVVLKEKNDPAISVTSISPGTVTVPDSPSATLTVSVPIGTPPGLYTVDINGTSGSLVREGFLGVEVIGPDFTLSSDHTSVSFNAGSIASATITVNPVNGFSDPVDLSVNPFPNLNASILPTTVTSIGGYSATLSLNSTIPGDYFVDVVGSTTSGLHHNLVIGVKVQAPPPPDFSIDPSLPTTTLCTAGTSCDTTITITPENGFSGTVTLNAYADTGLICNPLNPVIGGGTEMLTCGASSQGTYFVTVIGTSGSLFHSTAQITYQVSAPPDFSLSAGEVSPMQLFTGRSSGSSSITVTPSGGFSGPVTFGLSTPPPQGLSCQTISDWTGSNTPVLTCTADAAGDYSVTVVGTATINNLPVQRSTSVILFHFVDFTIDANPTAGTIYTGAAGTSTITIGALNQFTGSITLSTDNTECNLSTSTITDSGTADLSCTFATPGPKMVMITGTIMSLSHSVFVTFTVNAPPDFTISASSPVSFRTDATGSSTVSVTPSNGFTGSIDLSYTVSPSSGLTVSFDPTTLSYSYGYGYGYGTSRATFSSSIPGTYTVTIKGSSGNLKPTTTVTVTVTAIQQVPTAPSTILGLTPAVFYSIIGVVAAIIVAGVAMVFRSRLKAKK